MSNKEKLQSIPWSDQQDKLVIRMVNKQGKCWTRIAKQLQNAYRISRPANQIRERWDNHLNPDINKKNLTAQEQNILLELHQKYGNKWKSIAQKLSGRNQIPIENNHISQSRNQSTVRRNLRQINQYMKESKSGEQRINIFEPSKFTPYFELVSGLDLQGFDVINSSQFKNLAKNIINFSRRNSNKKYTQLTIQEKKNFEELLKQMLTLRQVSKNCDQNNQKYNNIKIERKGKNNTSSYEQYQDYQQQQESKESQSNLKDSQISQQILNQKVPEVMDVDAKQSSQKNQSKQKKSIEINKQKTLIKLEGNQKLKENQQNQNIQIKISNNFIPNQQVLLENQQIGDVIEPQKENGNLKKQSSYQMSLNLLRKINKLRSQLRHTPNKYLRSAYPSGSSYINSHQPYEVPPQHVISSQQHHMYDPMGYYPPLHPSHPFDYSMNDGLRQIQDNESREGIKQQ